MRLKTLWKRAQERRRDVQREVWCRSVCGLGCWLSETKEIEFNSKGDGNEVLGDGTHVKKGGKDHMGGKM